MLRFVSVVFAISLLLHFTMSKFNISRKYTNIPSKYQLEKVIITHRHGDRSQISRSLGSNYPEDNAITAIWHTKLPTNQNLEYMSKIALSHNGKLFDGDSNDIGKLKEFLYDGWDKSSYPYGQLTEIGSNQMIKLGKSISDRYFKFLDLENIEDRNLRNDFLLRSTHSCRTVQSLRSFLVGLLDYSKNIDKFKLIPSSYLPIIRVKSKEHETLFPQANASCNAIVNRRHFLQDLKPVSACLDDFDEFEAKLSTILGFSHGVPFLTVKEVLTCHLSHGIEIPRGLSKEDEEKATIISGYLWGTWFKDRTLNRLAIGRFIRDIFDDLALESTGDELNCKSGDIPSVPLNSHKMIIYSGHDSTLGLFFHIVSLFV